jgi:hypothetical protein
VVVVTVVTAVLLVDVLLDLLSILGHVLQQLLFYPGVPLAAAGLLDGIMMP